MKQDNKNWKRQSFNGNKVWVLADSKDRFIVKKGKVLVKYRKDQDYEYWVKQENIKPVEAAVKSPKNKKNISTNEKRKDKSADIPEDITDQTNDNTIIIYTDGASSGNPGPSGIGIFMKYKQHEKEISKYIGDATNNIAELEAIKIALMNIKRSDLPIRIFSDSSYAIGLLTKNWKPQKNQELILEIKDLMKGFKDLQLIKIKGHAGIEGNERADKLAVQAIKSNKK